MRVLTDPSGWFTVEVPDGWEMTTEDCVTTLRGPGKNGMMYLSAARHARGPQPSFGGADFLARFLVSLGMPIEESAIDFSPGPGCRIYCCDRENGGRLWRFWSVTDNETALLVSYTCELSQLGPEADEVERMVRSARLYHSAPSN